MTAGNKTHESALVDYARIVGALAIIYFHLKLPNGEFALFALTMFSTFASFFLARQLPQLSIKKVLGSRAKRVLIPWLVILPFLMGLDSRTHAATCCFSF
jgi:hypothetical protein